jgi:hypothetical protein
MVYSADPSLWQLHAQWDDDVSVTVCEVCQFHAVSCSRATAPAPELGPASDPSAKIVRRPGEANSSATTREVQQRVP